jgi:hypothetical protein
LNLSNQFYINQKALWILMITHFIAYTASFAKDKKGSEKNIKNIIRNY